MAEYIDAEQAYQIAKLIVDYIHSDKYHPVNFWAVIMDMINDIPLADVQPVVRCKDCKYRQYDAMFGDSWCNGKRVTDDWFCADGARMEQEGGR